jgi:hypothetical protein
MDSINFSMAGSIELLAQALVSDPAALKCPYSWISAGSGTRENRRRP